jgi:hypothetical protein
MEPTPLEQSEIRVTSLVAALIQQGTLKMSDAFTPEAFEISLLFYATVQEAAEA